MYTKGSTKGNIKARKRSLFYHMKGNISRDLKKWRERAELTQEQLAEKVGVRRETVGHWENQEKPNKWPKGSNCLKLSNILGVNITRKGITEDHINNMKTERPEKLDDENWYKKTIDSLIHINSEGIKEIRESKKEEIEELRQDKIRLHQHLDKLITRVNPSNNTE